MENIIYDADYVYSNKEMASWIRIEHGMKVKVNKRHLDMLQSEKELMDMFNLNIKRLDRLWYSVYFDSKNK